MVESSANQDSHAKLPICVICRNAIKPDENRATCPSCQTEYHADCWEENGGCGVYGCPEVPVTEQREAIDIPVSYWGQEHKSCPACGTEILAAAKRCRSCGATFQSARPEDSGEFHKRAAIDQRLPQVRSGVVRFFVCSVIPFLAPFAAIFGSAWYVGHREEIKALPPLYGGLAKLAVYISVGQTVFGILMLVLYGAFRA